MFENGVNFMAKHHLRRLSVNHWARDNRERSIYNSLAKTEQIPVVMMTRVAPQAVLHSEVKASFDRGFLSAA
ncbi:hypothetical protein GCM10027342_00560 [Photobacterium alginatilyticum]|nr:hypothetical protein [Photobacterium alginatilyticum]